MSEQKKEKPEVPSAIVSDRAKQVALRHLMQSEGWQVIKEYCLDQEKARIASIMSQPVGSHEQIYAQEYSKAEAWTFHTLAGLPKMLVDTIQDNIDLEISKLKEAGTNIEGLREDGDEEEGTPAVDSDQNAP